MDLSVITDDDRIQHFDAVFRDWINDGCNGDVYEMLISHHNGSSIREIAERHGQPSSTVHSWIISAKMKLRRAGFYDKIGRRSSMEAATRDARISHSGL